MELNEFQKILDKEFPNMHLNAHVDICRPNITTIFCEVASQTYLNNSERNNLPLIKDRILNSLQEIQKLIGYSIERTENARKTEEHRPD